MRSIVSLTGIPTPGTNDSRHSRAVCLRALETSGGGLGELGDGDSDLWSRRAEQTPAPSIHGQHFQPPYKRWSSSLPSPAASIHSCALEGITAPADTQIAGWFVHSVQSALYRVLERDRGIAQAGWADRAHCSPERWTDRRRPNPGGVLRLWCWECLKA
jgi:hypothetical protein